MTTALCYDSCYKSVIIQACKGCYEPGFERGNIAKLLKNGKEGLSVVCSSGWLSPFCSDELSRKSRPIDPADVISKIAA